MSDFEDDEDFGLNGPGMFESSKGILNGKLNSILLSLDSLMERKKVIYEVNDEEDRFRDRTKDLA